MKTVAQTVIEADHFYTIAAHTGNVIQAVEGTKEAGTVRLGKYEHKPEQEWSFIRVGDGVYRIRNRASGKLLDLTMTGTANGTWLHLWEDVGGTSQMWTVQPTPEGTVRLRSSWAGGKCVDTVGMGAAVGTVLQIWADVNGDNQFWTINEVTRKPKTSVKATTVKAKAAAEKAATEVVKAAEPVVEKAVKAAKPAAEKAVKVAKPAAEKAVKAAKPVVEKAVKAAEPVVEKAVEAAKPAAEKAVEAVKTAAAKTNTRKGGKGKRRK